MDINFDFKNTNQTVKLLHSERERLFYKMEQKGPHKEFISDEKGMISDDKARKKTGTQWVRLTGLPLGVASASLSVTFRAAAVGESLIKGVGNIFGSPFSKKCNLLRGVKQLCFDLPIDVVKFLVFTPLEMAGDLIVTPIATLFNPHYLAFRAVLEAMCDKEFGR